MPETADRMKAADLLVHGTFALRSALDRLAHPMHQPAPAEPLPPPVEEVGDEQRPTVGAAAGRAQE